MSEEQPNYAKCPHCEEHISTLVRMTINVYDTEQDKLIPVYIYKCGDCSAILKIVHQYG